MKRTKVRRAGALLIGLALVTAACGGDDDDDDAGGDATTASEDTAATTGGTGAETTEAAGAETTAPADTGGATTAGSERTGTGVPGAAGALEGLKGTTPLVELAADFTDRLLEIDPSLGTTFNYAAETYDAVTIIALAVERGAGRRHRLRQPDQRRSPVTVRSAPTSPPARRSSTPAVTSTTTASRARSSSPATASRCRPATAC